MTTYHVYLDVAGTGYNVFSDPLVSITTSTRAICLKRACVDSGNVATFGCAAIFGTLLEEQLSTVTDVAGAQADCAEYIGCFAIDWEASKDGLHAKGHELQ